ncbi:MAG: divergent polysaccharide deacetylase family protein [Candidatus Marinimicrobia bacterium]|nr:divergent polysaccharide deacetylase family protein [Candidatus Neomarinimicrobiota bacterium]MCF7829083.1 divergent polysaccharide deacetylase family protein [Candidatus Neomarinimicrobiota bacterium]MCF7881518.1 divergent polysaccharide deacetylase family protein [Candidatus Neomarinimicrobiota bacterium]
MKETETDEKPLLVVFIGVGVLLGGLLVWFILSQIFTSERSYTKASEKFRQELPRQIVAAGPGLHFKDLRESEDALPELAFAYGSDGDIDEISRRVERIITAGFSIVDRAKRPDIRAYGLSFKGKPVGRVILTRNGFPGQATVGIIVDDFGYYDNEIIDGFMDLPPKLAFAVIPGHAYSQKIARKAADRGFDVLIHMPMEPQKYEGGEEEFILKSGMSSRQVIQRLNRAFAHLPMAVGMNNHQGSLATEDADLMQTVLHILKDQDLFFVDSYTTANTVGYELAKKLAVPTGKRAVFLDNKPDTTYIKKQFAELVDEAMEKGRAIGICHNKKLTLEVLERYIPYYEQQGIRFAKISEVLEYPAVVL